VVVGVVVVFSVQGGLASVVGSVGISVQGGSVFSVQGGLETFVVLSEQGILLVDLSVQGRLVGLVVISEQGGVVFSVQGSLVGSVHDLWVVLSLQGGLVGSVHVL